MPTIVIPAAIRRRMTNPVAEVTVSGDTVGSALDALVGKYPQLKPALFEADGGLRQVIRIYTGETSIARQDGLATPVGEGEEIVLIPPIAGG